MYDACGCVLLDTALQKSLVPLVNKTQDGFHSVPEMSLSSSIEKSHLDSTIEETHVDSTNHYSLAHNSMDDCADDVTGQFYTAPKTGADEMVSCCLVM